MTTRVRLATVALALGLGLTSVPLTAASAYDKGHHRGHWKKGHPHYGAHYRYGPPVHYRYAPYRYAPVRYVYVPRRVYTRVIYDDDLYYPRPYSYARYRYVRPGVSISVGYADRGYYGGWPYPY